MDACWDFAAPEGTPVVAALLGQVLSSGLAGGYSVAIELEHAEPLRHTLYGHLSEIYVRPGQPVRQGEVIGRVGSTGISTGPHLHFELRTPSRAGRPCRPCQEALNPAAADRIAQSRLRQESLLWYPKKMQVCPSSVISALISC